MKPKPLRKLSGKPGFKLTARQEAANKILGSGSTHVLLVGGARSGKTFLIVRALVVRALRCPGARQAILRFRANAARRSLWLDTLPAVMRKCFPRVKFKLHQQDMYMELPGGSEIWVGGLDDKERIDKILGLEYCGIYFNETSEIPREAILTAQSRLAQKIEGLKNRLYYDLNPGGTGHYTHKLFIEGVSPEEAQKPLRNPADYAHCFLNPYDNKENLDPGYLQILEDLPARQRQRFLDGKYVAELEGALWTLTMIAQARIARDDLPDLIRIVVAVDPSGARGEYDVKADAIGICVAGMDVDGHLYILEDATGLYSPETWGRLVSEKYSSWKADRVVAEKNYGGDMVRAVIQAHDRNVSYREVNATRGKVIRAEPIAALYEKGRVHHVGDFHKLEDELTNFTTAGYIGSRSPNAADAAIWALTELTDGPAFGIGELYKRLAEELRNTSSTKTLSDAQKGDSRQWTDAMERTKALGKLTVPRNIGAPPSCPKCHNAFVSMYGESYRCNSCGATGPKESLATLVLAK